MVPCKSIQDKQYRKLMDKQIKCTTYRSTTCHAMQYKSNKALLGKITALSLISSKCFNFCICFFFKSLLLSIKQLKTSRFTKHYQLIIFVPTLISVVSDSVHFTLHLMMVRLLHSQQSLLIFSPYYLTRETLATFIPFYQNQ